MQPLSLIVFKKLPINQRREALALYEEIADILESDNKIDLVMLADLCEKQDALSSIWSKRLTKWEKWQFALIKTLQAIEDFWLPLLGLRKID